MKTAAPIKTSVFRRLLTYFLCVGLIPVVLLVGVAVVLSSTVSMNGIRTGLVSSTGHAGSLLEAELNKYRDSVAQFCIDTELADFLSEPQPSQSRVTQINQRIYLILAGQGGLLRMYILDAEGSPVLGTDALPEEYAQTNLEWGVFRALQPANGPIVYAEGVTIGGRAQENCIVVAGKVLQNGEVQGYVLLHIPQSVIRGIMQDAPSNLFIKHLLLDAQSYLIINEVFDAKTVFLPQGFHTLLQTPEGEAMTVQLPGDQAMLTVAPLGDTGIRLAGLASIALTARSNALLITISMLMVLIWTGFCYWLSKRMATGIVNPILEICEAMEVIEQGNLDKRVQIDREDEFAMMAGGLNHMVEQLNEQFNANLERQNRLRLAELKNLQAQISPHFLYNTLESIKWMARLHMNQEIVTVVEKLGILLKSGMNFKRDMIPLRDELHVVDSYLAIQQIGNDRLTAEIEVPNCLQSSLVPNLVIQPLVENAVVHCMEQKRGPVHITVKGRREGELLRITVQDNGMGIPARRLEEIFQTSPADNGSERIGLVNVHRRLQLYFGASYGLQVESKEGLGTTVHATMPFLPQEEAHV